MSYLTKNFLLKNKTAEKLYFEYAAKMPIFDYHCHLSEKEILADKEFENIFEIWLKGDHYKWRLMRNAGVSEEYITGKRTDKEKFVAYCKTLSTAFGNPLYHWSQMELEFFFKCNLEINEKNADLIWEKCNKVIKQKHLTPSALIKMSNVKTIFTTNEIFDDLSIFDEIKVKFPFTVSPAFRADKLMDIKNPIFINLMNNYGPFKSLDELETFITNKLEYFISCGCVASDIAVEKVYQIHDKKDADRVFKNRLKNKVVTDEDEEIYKGYMTFFLLQLYAKNNIRCELHIGAKRNNNAIAYNKIGPDTGYDCISEKESLTNLSELLNALTLEKTLPPMIVFNLNPKMNNEITTLLGCFQGSDVKGKLQYGAAWWFLDNKEGMIKQLKDMSATMDISKFIGMLTDSRSFLSYQRHHYFRRILCSYLGGLIENGEITKDIKLVGSVVEDICYNNATNYFYNK